VRQADRNASETRGQRARNAAAEPQSRSAPAPESRARDEASAAALSAEFAEESEADARQPLGDAPDDSSAELASGIALYRSARYAEAAATLEHFVSGIDPSDPRAPEAQYHLGAALAALGESRRARFVLERFLTLYPAHSRSSSVREALIELDRTEINRQLAPAAEPLAPEQ
jgi:TolA-binding protein